MTKRNTLDAKLAGTHYMARHLGRHLEFVDENLTGMTLVRDPLMKIVIVLGALVNVHIGEGLLVIAPLKNLGGGSAVVPVHMVVSAALVTKEMLSASGQGVRMNVLNWHSQTSLRARP